MRSVGAHVSLNSTLGVFHSLESARLMQDMSAAQIFLGPPQTYNLIKLSEQDVRKCVEQKRQFPHFKTYVHAPYVLHAFAKPENVQKNNATLAKHVKLAAACAFDGYVLHMGGTKHYESEDLEASRAEYLSLAISLCETIGVETLKRTQLLFENCASGNWMSGDLLEINVLIERLRQLDYNVGLCLDTVHAFAWGYDLNSEKECGGEAVPMSCNPALYHLNSATDKVTCGSHLDRHEAITQGKISQLFFEWLLNYHPETPVILERDDVMKVAADMQFVSQVEYKRITGEWPYSREQTKMIEQYDNDPQNIG